jgi:hypothetical protein
MLACLQGKLTYWLTGACVDTKCALHQARTLQVVVDKLCAELNTCPQEDTNTAPMGTSPLPSAH